LGENCQSKNYNKTNIKENTSNYVLINPSL
jgi:hypothetical protein